MCVCKCTQFLNLYVLCAFVYNRNPFVCNCSLHVHQTVVDYRNSICFVAPATASIKRCNS